MPSLAQVLARPSAFSSAGERSSRLLGGDMPPQNPNFAVTGIAHLQGESICRAPQPARPFAPVTKFRNRGKRPGGLGCWATLSDELREVGDGWVSGDDEPGAEVVPERDAELGAGLGEAERLQLGRREIIKIARRRHAATESQLCRDGNRSPARRVDLSRPSACPAFCPCYNLRGGRTSVLKHMRPPISASALSPLRRRAMSQKRGSGE